MKTVNLQVRINENLKQEVSNILKAQGLSYTSMLDALFRQIIKMCIRDRSKALCDGPQALRPDQFTSLMKEVFELRKALVECTK